MFAFQTSSVMQMLPARAWYFENPSIESQTFSVKGQLVNILCFVSECSTEAAIDNMWMNEHSSVSIQLCLQNQVWIGYGPCNVPTPSKEDDGDEHWAVFQLLWLHNKSFHFIIFTDLVDYKRTQWGWLFPAPQYLGLHLGRLEWLGLITMLGDWNHLDILFV